MYKVLFLGWEYYPVFSGGLGVVCNAMAEELAEQDMEVYVALPTVPKELPISKVKFPQNKITFQPTSFKHKNIKVKIANIDLDPYASGSKLGTNKVTKNCTARSSYQSLQTGNLYGDDLMGKVAVYRDIIGQMVTDIEFDVIHAHDWMTYLAAIDAKITTGKKCVLHVHATELDRTADNPNEVIFNIEQSMLRQADKVIAVSEHTKNTLTNKYGIGEHKIKVIHNALADQHTYNIDQELNWGKGKTVTFLGRVVVQKGAMNFIKIARKVVDVLPDTKFIFAGDGSMLHEAIELVAELDLQNNFIFTGGVDRYHGDLVYKNSDLYLMTSGSEPFGITALESINQGTPVIVTKTSGVAEVLPNALSVDFWDVDKFADLVIGILQDPDLHALLKQEQINDYSKISWKGQIEKMVEIYHELLGGDKPIL